MKVIISPEPIELPNTWYGVSYTGNEKDIYCMFQTKAQAQYHIDACAKLANFQYYKIVIVKIHSS